MENLRKESVAETVRAWRTDGVHALVWDNAPADHAKLGRAVGPVLVPLPPYSPELNPPDRLFEEIRRRVEATLGTIEAKVAAVEAVLQDLAHHREQLRRLAAWAWITQALSRLPARSLPALPWRIRIRRIPYVGPPASLRRAPAGRGSGHPACAWPGHDRSLG